MASNNSVMAFLSFPREIRDLIYTYLTSSEQLYSIAFTKGVTMVEAFETSAPELGIINTCKAIQYEMVEMICRNNAFRFSFPGVDTVGKSLYHELAPLMTHIELYIDFGTFSWDQFRAGHHNPELDRISNQVCKTLHSLNNRAKRCIFYRNIINDNNRYVSPLLRLKILDVIKTMVGLETLTIFVLCWKQDMRKLGTLLAPSLGPSTLHYRWPSLPWAQWKYGCVKFHPKEYLAKRSE